MAELGPGSDANEQLNSIRDVAIRGSEIVRQLMIYAGKESDVMEPIDASKVVQGMLGLLKVAVSRHVALATDLGDGLPAVRARPAQLSQIVMNLVINASDALGNRDGVIRITTQHVARGSAEAIAKGLATDDYVQLDVADTGCGMSPETQTKIFDPFFTTKFSGRGLGLRWCTELCVVSMAQFAWKARSVRVPLFRLCYLRTELRLARPAIPSRVGSKRDLNIPGASSQEVLDEAAVAQPNVKVVLTSAYSEQVAKPMMRASGMRFHSKTV